MRESNGSDVQVATEWLGRFTEVAFGVGVHGPSSESGVPLDLRLWGRDDGSLGQIDSGGVALTACVARTGEALSIRVPRLCERSKSRATRGRSCHPAGE